MREAIIKRRHLITLGLVVGMAGCIDRDGLDPNVSDGGAGDTANGGAGGATGGSGGTATGGTGGNSMGGAGGKGGAGGAGGGQMGGAGGTAGAGGGPMGGTGGTRPDAGADGPITCGPVCAIYCPNGNVLDSRGCPTCQCKPTVCPAVACDLFCKYGYQRDANGCEKCACNPPPGCQPVTCKLLCPNGFQKDPQGCEICACNPPTCQPAECPPPPPGVPISMCSDGTIGGAVCERASDGRCTWIFRECPPNCSQWRDAATCGKIPACRWLEPGCAEPKLATAGCYSRAQLDCTPTSCTAGKTCLKRTIDPCSGGRAAAPADALVPVPIPPPICAACAETIGICL